MARTVVDPQGRRWKVRRRWLGTRRAPRWRGGDADALSWIDLGGFGGADGILGAIVAVLAIIALAALIAFFLLPLAVLLVEPLVFLLLAGVGLMGRVAFRRPWTLEARVVGGPTKLSWSVSGWRNSREKLDEIATALERGLSAPGASGG